MLISTLIPVCFTVKFFEIRNDRVMVVNLLHFEQYFSYIVAVSYIVASVI